MINSSVLKDLFKPYELHFLGLEDLLNVTGLSLKDGIKIDVQDECSKSIDESCMNHECKYNFIKLHGNEFYNELMHEIKTNQW